MRLEFRKAKIQTFCKKQILEVKVFYNEAVFIGRSYRKASGI